MRVECGCGEDWEGVSLEESSSYMVDMRRSHGPFLPSFPIPAFDCKAWIGSSQSCGLVTHTIAIRRPGMRVIYCSSGLALDVSLLLFAPSLLLHSPAIILLAYCIFRSDANP